MKNKAHSYHPAGDSLEAKVASLRNALADRQIAQASLRDSHERLGTTEEIQYALSVSEKTLEIALNNLSGKDIKEAQAKGLLNKDELTEVHIAQRSEKMKAQRSEASDEDSHSHKF